MKNKTFQEGSKRAGLTLIELLVIVAIIGILATAIFVSINQSRRNARINAAKTSLKTVLPMVVACLDSNGGINVPSVVDNGGNQICNAVSGSNWPVLANGYKYETGDLINSGTCFFTVSTNGDTSADLACSCATQLCE